MLKTADLEDSICMVSWVASTIMPIAVLSVYT